MEQVSKYPKNKKEAYTQFIKELPYTIDSSLPLISNLSNISAMLNQLLENINWVGFYLCQDEILYLGPFQGLPACTKIELGKGVCGTSLMEKRSLVVKDVHQFPGHIVCDSASNSEIVIPIYDEKNSYGVLDIDSYVYDNFGEVDKQKLEMIVAEYILPLFKQSV